MTNDNGIPIIGKSDGQKTTQWFPENVQPKFIETEMVPVKVDLECPECHKGVMVATGQAWATNPPGVHHECTNCGYRAAIQGAQFPMVTHKPKDQAVSDIKTEAVPFKLQV